MNEKIVAGNIKNLTENVTEIILQQKEKKDRILVALDGRCASGKTTLAMELKELLDCEVVHMDHFFLRPEQRSEVRLNTPGENIDHERFLQEVLIPLSKGRGASYRPFNCKNLELDEVIRVGDSKIYIIEGSYACHPLLWPYYDVRIFLSVAHEEQMRRIIKRNGEDAAQIFRSKWIPLEEQYFEACGVACACDFCFTT